MHRVETARSPRSRPHEGTGTTTAEADGDLATQLAELRNRFPRVALTHDWLTVPGGSEQVLMALLDIFPEAEVFRSCTPQPWPSAIRDRDVHT